MLNRLLAIAAKISGLGIVVQKLNGLKAYIGGSILILQGVTGLLQTVMGINDLHALIDFGRSIAENPDLGKIAAGLIAFGVRHAISKNAPQP